MQKATLRVNLNRFNKCFPISRQLAGAFNLSKRTADEDLLPSFDYRKITFI